MREPESRKERAARMLEEKLEGCTKDVMSLKDSGFNEDYVINKIFQIYQSIDEVHRTVTKGLMAGVPE